MVTILNPDLTPRGLDTYRFTLMPILRRSAYFALALILSLFAIAPHQHEGLTDVFGADAAGTITNLGSCDAPNAHHLHNSREVVAHPCVACVRHHSAGALHAGALASHRLVEIPSVSAFWTVVRSTVIVVTRLRGPPV